MKKSQLKRQEEKKHPVDLEYMRKTEELIEGNVRQEERIRMAVFQEMLEEEMEMNKSRIETTNKIDQKEKGLKLLLVLLLLQEIKMNNKTKEIHNLTHILSQNYSWCIEFRKNSQINCRVERIAINKNNSKITKKNSSKKKMMALSKKEEDSS